MIKEKNVVVCLLLSIVTCGIYGIIWFINLTDDVKMASGDDSFSGIRDFLLTLVTCGLYGWYWAYKMGKAVNNIKTKNGQESAEDNSILYLIFCIFGFNIVNFCLIQSELNKLVNPTVSNEK